MGYTREYLAWRAAGIDTSEWLDILRGLRALGARRSDTVYELGAGSGGLILFLRARGFRARGCDLLGDGRLVERCDLEREYPPPADYYVFQHFIEHIDQGRAVELLRYCLERSRGVVGILPGHYSDDPTHVVNHYEYEEALELCRRAEARYCAVVPDTASYANPAARDWLLVASRHPFNPARLQPLWLRLARKLVAVLGGVR